MRIYISSDLGSLFNSDPVFKAKRIEQIESILGTLVRLCRE